MEFCDKFPFYSPSDCISIEPYKSMHRQHRLCALIQDFHDRNRDEYTSVYTIQELRSYNKAEYAAFFRKLNYTLILFPCYPGVRTESVAENSDEKRFSFINGVAIPSTWAWRRDSFYLSETPDRFSPTTAWGKSGSRLVGGVLVSDGYGNGEFGIYTTQFGMDATERIESAKLVAARLADTDMPLVFAGDFNSFRKYRGDEQIDILRNGLTCLTVDPVDQNGVRPGGSFVGMRPVEDERFCIDLETGRMDCMLDHIFIRGFQCIDAGIITPSSASDSAEEARMKRLRPVSDHCPVWCKIKL